MGTPTSFDTLSVSTPRAGIDTGRLRQFLVQELPKLQNDAELEVLQFGHGQSNPTYLLQWGPHRLVLRKKPAGKILASAHAVEREFQVLSALSRTSVPVPTPLALCEDSRVVGTPFYVMQFVQGRIFVDPNLPGMSSGTRRSIYRGMCHTLVALHGVRPQGVGLTAFGSPDNYCRRQVKRWSAQYVASVPEPMPAVSQLMAWLEANVPAEDATAPPAVCHGDYRLDNLVFGDVGGAPIDMAAAAGVGLRAERPGLEDARVLAVLDWELSTVGNRWADVAYNCLPYHYPAGLSPQLLRLGGVAPSPGGAAPLPTGVPAEGEYLRWYCEASGLPLPPARDWAFYLALGLFRLSAILAGVQARLRQGNASSSQAGSMSHDTVIAGLAAAAHAIVARSGSPSPSASVARGANGGDASGAPPLRPPPPPPSSALASRAALQPGSSGLAPAVAVLRERLLDFMERRIYPSEAVFEAHAGGPQRWTVHPLMEQLKGEAKALGLWNLWLPKHLAEKLEVLLVGASPAERGTLLGAGLTNLEYAHLCEVTGRSAWAPEAFNCSAPDTGNMEVLAKYGTEAQQREWLLPLLRGTIRSCFAMTEKAVASADATNIQSSIRRVTALAAAAAHGRSSSSGTSMPSGLDTTIYSRETGGAGSSVGGGGSSGDSYVLDGVKWWTSGAMDPRCRLCIFMGKTDPKAAPHRQQSMVLVPMAAPGVRVVRPLMVFGFDDAPHGHAEVCFDQVVVPLSNMLLGEGRGFEIAQGRLGPGRLHHCMRLVGAGERALELMAARGLSRSLFGGPLSAQGSFRAELARRRIDLDGARLLVLSAADALDRAGGSVKGAMREIAQAKVAAPLAVLAALDSAIQAHGGMGVCQDTPLARLWSHARTLRIADGPDEVHLGTIAKMELARVAKAMPKL